METKSTLPRDPARLIDEVMEIESLAKESVRALNIAIGKIRELQAFVNETEDCLQRSDGVMLGQKIRIIKRSCFELRHTEGDPAYPAKASRERREKSPQRFPRKSKASKTD